MKKTVTPLYLIPMHKALYALPIWLLICFALSAHAQTDTTKKLKEVNVNAKTPLKQQAITPSQQVSSADFKRFGALNVADALIGFAGVNIKDYGGIGGLKTISVRSLGANHTGVLYDGVQLNDAQNGQIDLGRFNLYNIGEITLFNGQAPSIVQPARSFASASILAITTKKPLLSAAKPYQITAGIAGGSFGLINPYLQWQQRVNTQWSFVLNGNYTGANGRYKYKVNGDGSDTLAIRHNSDVKTYQTDGGLYWAKSDSNKFKLQFNYNNNNRGLPGPVIFYNDHSSERLENRDLLVQSSYERIAGNSLHLLINSKFSQNYLHYTDPDFLNNTGGLNEHYTQHEFYQSAAVGYHLLPGWEVSYASDVAVVNLQSDVYTYQFPTRITLLNALATNAMFGKWQLQGNVLHTYITESVKTGTAAVNRAVFSPTIAASFKPFDNQGFLLRAFYKDIFRAPTLSEQYYYATVPRSIRPEFAKQYNLGITYQKSYTGLLNDIALTADAYYNNVKDKIIYLPVRGADIPSVTNLGAVDIKGLDVTLTIRWLFSQSFTGLLSAAYTYQSAIDVTSPKSGFYLDQIPYTPKNLINLNAGFTYSKLSFYYNYQLSSSRYYTSNNTPAYYLSGYNASNASVTYSFLPHKYPVSISGEVTNIFNLNYVIIRNYPMPGRSFRLSMQITI